MTCQLHASKFTREHGELIGFVYKKVHPVSDATSTPASDRWRPTARRWDVLLPAGAPDDLQDLAELVRSFDRHTVADQNDLALHLKFVMADASSYHEHWERIRAFVMGHLVVAARLPTIMVLHSPPDRGFSDAAEPHVHVIALARQRLPGRWDRTAQLLFGGLGDIVSAWSSG